MRTIYLDPNDSSKKIVKLSDAREGLATHIIIDVSVYADNLPGCGYELMMKNPAGVSYRRKLTCENGQATYVVMESDTVVSGQGEMQLLAHGVNGEKAMTRKWTTLIEQSLLEDEDDQDTTPLTPLIEQIYGYKDDAEKAASESAASAAAAADGAAAAKQSEEAAAVSEATATAQANRAEDEAEAAESSAVAAAASSATAAAAATESLAQANRAEQEATEARKSAESAAESAANAEDAEGTAETIARQFTNAAVEVDMLAPSAAPTGAIEKDVDGMTFVLGIPKSNVAMATFEVDNDMELLMHTPDGFADVDFAVTDDGELEVVIG